MQRALGGWCLSVWMFVACSAGVAYAAPEFAVSVTGKVQGKFKGEMIQKGFEGKFAGLGFEQEVISPRDAATGLATGKRQYRPLRIKQAWGPASLQFIAALNANEPLAVAMDFFAPDAAGMLVLDHTVRLTNATVVSYKSHADRDDLKAPQVDDIELVFQQIEIIDHRGKGNVVDTWIAP